ncbi:MAG: transketolase [Alphaproteobacteria bacterium]|nr:transketolase [Alphaproteobacteria bacterium]|tara:strand:- start:114 stop:956 length:843 start_codon:yes stop_codon:yes gene_type:complete
MTTADVVVDATGFDLDAARRRCAQFRRRILEISQTVPALHIGGAFSSTEIVDLCFHGLMRHDDTGESPDTFLMSKGHGCMIMYAVLEARGTLPREELERFCTSEGILGIHPDYGVPGVEASTGALGHGLSMSLGMAYANRSSGVDGNVYCVVSDGELQEGSTWEAILMAASLDVSNLVLFVDNNDFQSLGRTSITHPAFYPVGEKLSAFGWETVEIDGHDSAGMFAAVQNRKGDKPFAVVAKTIKGKGVSYMEDQAIWHYRAPNEEEYAQALRELAEVEK